MSIKNILTIAALAAVIIAPPTMANDWQKTKHHWLYPTTENAVPAPESADTGPAADSIEAWQKAKNPALFATDGKAVKADEALETPRVGSIEAWKRAKFSHLQKTTKR
ncbi:hypothetical protein [Nevskia ramosa]|uniref:hypothetical protein n=1 Tax=Nevskia ramosa TaxID=64002 RepID=UPI0003B491D7|nr:hypothetical protein [Nevskia ramosa]